MEINKCNHWIRRVFQELKEMKISAEFSRSFPNGFILRCNIHEKRRLRSFQMECQRLINIGVDVIAIKICSYRKRAACYYHWIFWFHSKKLLPTTRVLKKNFHIHFWLFVYIVQNGMNCENKISTKKRKEVNRIKLGLWSNTVNELDSSVFIGNISALNSLKSTFPVPPNLCYGVLKLVKSPSTEPGPSVF